MSFSGLKLNHDDVAFASPLSLSARCFFSGLKQVLGLGYCILSRGKMEDVLALVLSAETFIELHRLDSK